jgi:biotin carboxyl carrier protein
MRYYFINQDMKEFYIDVNQLKKTSDADQLEFLVDKKPHTAYIKRLAGKNYISFDKISWSKLPNLGINEILVSHSEVFKVYRGFKPSGLFAGGAGAMVTQMPGKVVKINVKVGDKVVKGQTILILEAMKMENEIKAGVDGEIKSINVKDGQALDAGTLMVEIE